MGLQPNGISQSTLLQRHWDPEPHFIAWAEVGSGLVNYIWKRKTGKNCPWEAAFSDLTNPLTRNKKKLPAQARKCLPLVCGPSDRGATTTNSRTPRDGNCVSNDSKHQAQVAFPTGTLKCLRPKFTFYGEIFPNWTEVHGWWSQIAGTN